MLRTTTVRRALTPGGTPTDVAWASWRATDAAGAVAAPSREQPFLVMAGVGHDAATVDATDPKNKDRIGWLAYLTAGVARLRERPLDMRVSFDMTPARRIRTWTLIVASAVTVSPSTANGPGSMVTAVTAGAGPALAGAGAATPE